MVVFPNAKINLGLNIVARRSDGYHELDMAMLPIGWCDILEIVPAAGDSTTLHTSGRPVNCPVEKNLVYKAWTLCNEYMDNDLPPVDIYLHKVVPDGAGLGGGSSDAAFTLVTLNRLFGLGITDDNLAALAARLGADCPFFIHNRPMLCQGTGTEMTPVDIDFGEAKYILVAKDDEISVSTSEAYGGVVPSVPHITVAEILRTTQISEWSRLLHNGFEPHIFAAKPAIKEIKDSIIDAGAIYASMSGSGSAVYGLFADVKMAEKAAESLGQCTTFVGSLT